MEIADRPINWIKVRLLEWLMGERFRIWNGETEWVTAYTFYEPGWNGLPSEAGMLMRIQVGLRDMMASTTMVAT